MKLTQAGKAYEPHIGGVETVMREVAGGAVDRGWDSRVVVAAEDRRGRQETRDGTVVVRTPTLARPLSFPLTVGYGRALAEAEADVLLVHEPTLLAATSLRTRPTLRHGFGRIMVWWHSDIIRQRALAPVYGPIIDHQLRTADRIIVATPHHISSSEVLPRFVDKIEVVPYGIDLSRYEPTPDRSARVTALKEDLAGDDALIVSVGRLARYKGIGQLVAAFEQVRGAHLVVAGDGPCASEVAAGAAAQAGRLTMMPHLDDELFVDLLWAADVFAMPSIHNSEAFGIAQVEAMACRTPVVTYDLPTGVTWVNRHGETGLVAPLGDVQALARSLQDLIDDPAYRSELADGAHEWAHATFDRNDMLNSVFTLLEGANSWIPVNVPPRLQAGSHPLDH